MHEIEIITSAYSTGTLIESCKWRAISSGSGAATQQMRASNNLPLSDDNRALGL